MDAILSQRRAAPRSNAPRRPSFSCTAAAAAPKACSVLPTSSSSRSWYPYSLLAVTGRNESHLSNSLATVGVAVGRLEGLRFTPQQIALLGLSQGGCLALEFAARNARCYGAVIGLSAGIVGPDETQRGYSGSLSNAPVFPGRSDVDSHIPVERVRESCRVLSALGGNVIEKIYPRVGHEIIDDEVDHVRLILSHLVATP